MTGDFRSMVGCSGSNEVFRGVLDGSTVVAIKRITSNKPVDEADFLREVSIIASVHHCSLVRCTSSATASCAGVAASTWCTRSSSTGRWNGGCSTARNGGASCHGWRGDASPLTSLERSRTSTTIATGVSSTLTSSRPTSSSRFVSLMPTKHATGEELNPPRS